MGKVAAVLSLAIAAAHAGQIATVEGFKLELGRKLTLPEPIEVQDLTFYQAKAIATGENCVAVSGYIVSHLPDHLYTVHLEIAFWGMANVGRTSPLAKAKATITTPPPERRTRFTTFAVISHTSAQVYQLQISVERITAKQRPEIPQGGHEAK